MTQHSRERCCASPSSAQSLIGASRHAPWKGRTPARPRRRRLAPSPSERSVAASCLPGVRGCAGADFPAFSRMSSRRAYIVSGTMTRIGQDTGSIEVFTFREGALSALGHDLRLRASRFDIDVLADSVVARVDAGSLRVAAAMRAGTPAEGTLSEKDKAEIERNCAREVLEAHRHPEATFVSSEVKQTDGGWSVRGTLTIHGVPHEGTFDVQRKDGKAVARIDVDLRSFGMKPYSAMLGALRVKPQVLLVVEAPVPAGA